MSFPNIPNVKPEIKLDRHEIINLLLSSIAFEELGLAHLINAEGEKMQRLLKDKDCDEEELIEANKSVVKMLRTVIKKEMLLQFKLEDVLEIPDHHFKKEHNHKQQKHEKHKDHDDD